MKISKTDVAILQALHAYNQSKIVHIHEPTGYTVGSQEVTITMNRMVWGLFEQSILKAIHDRPDLMERNPNLVYYHVQCMECKGAGYFPIEDQEAAISAWNDGLEPHDGFYLHPGSVLSTPCSSCQSTGFKLKEKE